MPVGVPALASRRYDSTTAQAPRGI